VTNFVTPSSKGNDSLVAGALVTVSLGILQQFYGFTFEYPGMEAAIVVLVSWAYARFAANRRPTV